MKYVIIVLLFCACSAKVLNSTQTTVKDSVVYTTRVVHDTVRIAASNVGIEWLNTVDSTFEEQSGQAHLKIVSKGGKSRADCRCDSLTIAKRLAIHDTIHHIVREKTKARETIKFISSPFDKFTRWFFIAFCCAVALYIGAKLVKV